MSLYHHQNVGRNHHKNIANTSFENVSQFKCLGTVVHAKFDSGINDEEYEFM